MLFMDQLNELLAELRHVRRSIFAHLGLTFLPNSGRFKTGVTASFSVGSTELKGEVMKRSKFSEQHIAYALRLAESGTPVVDVCRQIGVSEATYYTWKKKFGDLGVTELRRLKMLEDENARLKRIAADLTLDKQIAAGGRSKKALKALKRRELAAWECRSATR